MERQEQEKTDRVETFDTLFTNNHIQIYKVLLPYFAPSMQKHLAVYIKYMEFQYTFLYFKQHSLIFPLKEEQNDTATLFKTLIPYCSGAEKKNLEKMMEMTSNMKNAQEMMDTLNMMKDLFPDGFPLGEGGEMSPDIMQMFQMFAK